MVSVVIPVYNVSGYVQAAIASILNQTFTNIEIIVVDDCSTDDSMNIIEQFNDSRIYIIRHDRNKGLSAARNTGLKAARGEWVYFFDGDDLITNDCIDTLVNLSQKVTDADMIVGQYDEFYEEADFSPARWKQFGGLYDNDIIGSYLRLKYPVTAWNKLIKKTFLVENALFFEEGLIHEDSLWSFQCACLMKKVVVSEHVTYHYRQRAGSIDKQENILVHKRNYALVNCLQRKFVFEHGLELDSRIFIRLTNEWYQLLYDAKGIDSYFASSLVCHMKAYPSWTILQVLHIDLPVREKLKFFYRFYLRDMR